MKTKKVKFTVSLQGMPVIGQMLNHLIGVKSWHEAKYVVRGEGQRRSVIEVVAVCSEWMAEDIISVVMGAEMALIWANYSEEKIKCDHCGRVRTL